MVFLSMDVNLLLLLVGAIFGASIIFCICFCLIYKVCIGTEENDADKVHRIHVADLRSAKIGYSMNPRSVHETNLQNRQKISRSSVFGSDCNLNPNDSMDGKLTGP